MFETERRTASVFCPFGHVFFADLLVGIDADTDPDLLFSLNADGTQLLVCPSCARSWSVAEPVSVGSSSRGVYALLIPDVLSHRVLELQAAALLSLSAESAPPTIEKARFRPLSRKSLEAELAPRDGTSEDAAPEKQNASAGISRAFADLVSIAPPPQKK